MTSALSPTIEGVGQEEGHSIRRCRWFDIIRQLYNIFVRTYVQCLIFSCSNALEKIPISTASVNLPTITTGEVNTTGKHYYCAVLLHSTIYCRLPSYSTIVQYTVILYSTNVQHYSTVLLYSTIIQYYRTILSYSTIVQYYCTVLCRVLLYKTIVQDYCTVLCTVPLYSTIVRYYRTVLLQYYCTVL